MCSGCAGLTVGAARTEPGALGDPRDNGYHEDAFTRRCDENVMAAMMVARSFGMWICARRPGRTTEQVKSDLNLHPAKLVRIMMKGGLQ